MGFTFCTEVEFLEVARKWRDDPPPAEPTEEEHAIYSGAFMPHLQKGE